MYKFHGIYILDGVEVSCRERSLKGNCDAQVHAGGCHGIPRIRAAAGGNAGKPNTERSSFQSPRQRSDFVTPVFLSLVFCSLRGLGCRNVEVGAATRTNNQRA